MAVKITEAIGAHLNHGYAGSYGRQPDMIVNTFPAGGEDNIVFGAPLKLSNGAVIAMGEGDTAASFIGIAGREFKSALEYLSQVGAYAPKEPVSVFQRGSINAKCQKGSPAYGTSVYIRVKANTSYPSAVIGGLEAEADETNTVELKGCMWMGSKDANDIAELRITTFPNAGVVNA